MTSMDYKILLILTDKIIRVRGDVFNYHIACIESHKFHLLPDDIRYYKNILSRTKPGNIKQIISSNKKYCIGDLYYDESQIYNELISIIEDENKTEIPYIFDHDLTIDFTKKLFNVLMKLVAENRFNLFLDNFHSKIKRTTILSTILLIISTRHGDHPATYYIPQIIEFEMSELFELYVMNKNSAELKSDIESLFDDFNMDIYINIPCPKIMKLFLELVDKLILNSEVKFYSHVNEMVYNSNYVLDFIIPTSYSSERVFVEFKTNFKSIF